MSATILVIAEQRQGRLNPQSLEAVVAAQKLAAAGGARVVVALPGSSVSEAAGELSAARVDELLLLEHALLEPYTADAFVAACRGLIERLAPEYVVFPHTYLVRDFAPTLAAGFSRSVIADCVDVKTGNGGPVFVRQMFQGKTHAEVAPEGAAPHFVTFQAGAFSLDDLDKGAAPVAAAGASVALAPAQIRVKAEAPYQAGKQAVDLSQAELIVSVGRGIKSPENIEAARRLATALGAELGASRPVCDEGWLPLERQIGSSGQTVAPKLYLALGISGAVQHLVGMKGAHTIVAVNKDANAPIFGVADYGIVGDLNEVIPALVKALEKR